MSTINQVEANRLNAMKSTGPSEASFPVTSQNALKTGLYAKSLLIRGEKREDLDTLTDEYYGRYQPQSPDERDYVDMLIRDSWRLRRFDAVEAQMWEFKMSNHSHLDANSPLGQMFFGADQQFARLHRMIAATRRSFKESLHELERLQAARKENRATHPSVAPAVSAASESTPDPPPAPNPQSPVPAPKTPEIGFVPSTPTALRSAPAPRHLIPAPQAREAANPLS